MKEDIPGAAARLETRWDRWRARRRWRRIAYLSSSPWNLYGLFQAFFEHHGIPPGPILLKDYGVTRRHLLSSGHRRHKLDAIEGLMAVWPDLPLVLVGDSGQQDPEIYLHLARRAPERVRAVFVRDVTGPRRDREVHALAEEAGRLGVPMVLARDTETAADAPARLGLIRPAPQ